MKVLHIIGSLDIKAGGPSRSVPQTCIHLAKLGISIEIIARPSSEPVDIPVNGHLSVRYLSIDELCNWSKGLEKKDADIIHLQHVWDPYIHVMAKAAQKVGIPYVITPRGMLEPWIMKRNAWKKQLAMALYQSKDIKKATAIHCTSELEKQNVRGLRFRNAISVIPNGLDLTIVPTPKVEYGSKRVIFMSRIHPKKGIELLLDAWHILKNDAWSLEIAGDGNKEYIENLRRKVKQLGLRNVQFVGPKYGDDKWTFLKSADLFILPTYSENFGIVVAEALLIGVPVITTIGTPWEELNINNCGWWIEIGTAPLVATLEEAMMKTPLQIEQMGKQGIKLVEEVYNITSVGNKLKELYGQILGKSI